MSDEQEKINPISKMTDKDIVSFMADKKKAGKRDIQNLCMEILSLRSEKSECFELNTDINNMMWGEGLNLKDLIFIPQNFGFKEVTKTHDHQTYKVYMNKTHTMYLLPTDDRQHWALVDHFDKHISRVKLTNAYDAKMLFDILGINYSNF